MTPRDNNRSSVPFVHDLEGFYKESLGQKEASQYTKDSDAYPTKGMEGLFDNQILNVKEVASFLGVSTKTVYEKSQDGLLPHQRIGNRYLFLRSELVRFLKGE